MNVETIEKVEIHHWNRHCNNLKTVNITIFINTYKTESKKSDCIQLISERENKPPGELDDSLPHTFICFLV